MVLTLSSFRVVQDLSSLSMWEERLRVANSPSLVDVPSSLPARCAPQAECRHRDRLLFPVSGTTRQRAKLFFLTIRSVARSLALSSSFPAHGLSSLFPKAQYLLGSAVPRYLSSTLRETGSWCARHFSSSVPMQREIGKALCPSFRFPVQSQRLPLRHSYLSRSLTSFSPSFAECCPWTSPGLPPSRCISPDVERGHSSTATLASLPVFPPSLGYHSRTSVVCQPLSFQFFRFSGRVCPSTPSRLYYSASSTSAALAPCRRKAEARPGEKKLDDVLGSLDISQIRNFCIIAHVDHGKSTLSDRLLEVTGTIEPGSKSQFLDTLEVETARGITVKAQACSLLHRCEVTDSDYLLNLIDTPGHSDFSHEVSRGLSVCQGAVLLVDGSQGIQAQTIKHFRRATQRGLQLIAAINKVDLPVVREHLPALRDSIAALTGVRRDEILEISSKTGYGIDDLLLAIVEKLPAPVSTSRADAPVQALIFDSWFDPKNGIVLLVAVKEGILKPGRTLQAAQSKKVVAVKEVGVFHPFMTATNVLRAGQVGYICSNLKRTEDACVGDTLIPQHLLVPLPSLPDLGGRPKCSVYAGIFPEVAKEYDRVQIAIRRLLLTDPAIEARPEVNPALGQGFRCGFLGILHLDVFRQRLETEYDVKILITSPTVPYKVFLKSGKEVTISSPSDFPDYFDRVEEPVVKTTMVIPRKAAAAVQELCLAKRGEEVRYECMQEPMLFAAASAEAEVDERDRVLMEYTIPLSEVIVDFSDKLQALTSGLASWDYVEAGHAPADVVKVGFRFNGDPCDALGFLAQRDRAREQGIKSTRRLATLIPQHPFEVTIHCIVNSKVIAREVVRAMKKDVLAGTYGCDNSRKRKLFEKEKERQ
ncbi:gtp-binding protein, partial [Cystoisospora suis]